MHRLRLLGGVLAMVGAVTAGILSLGSGPADVDVRAADVPTSVPSTTTSTTSRTATPTTEPAPRWETNAPGPARVVVPKIGVDAPVIDLGLNPDGTLEVPSEFADAGWWSGGAGVGEQGPAVIVGHVDSWNGPAVFYRLGDLDVGDEARVVRDDGSVKTFVVYAKETVPKDAFPTERVYGDTEVPELRLVTCGGDFDRSTRHYVDNVIVYLRISEAVDLPA